MTDIPSRGSARLSNNIGLLSGFVFLCAVLLQSSIVVVDYDEVGLRARFGTLTNILAPGIHLKLPFGVDDVAKVSASKIIVQEFGYRSAGEAAISSEALNAERRLTTADLNFVEISMAIQYQIADPVAYLSTVQNPDMFIRSATEAITREIVGGSESSDLFTKSGQMIAEETKARLQAYLDAFSIGVAIKAVEIREIAPPAAVLPSFDKLNEARQQMERQISEAERRGSRKIADANARAAKIRADGTGEAMRNTTAAYGQITQFSAFEKVHRHAPDLVQRALYLDTMAKVLPEVESLYVTDRINLPTLPLLNFAQNAKD